MLKVREALTNNAIVPYYQPIIDNKTMKIVKYECLARLVDFNSIIAPYYFIEPARLAGLLPKITETMFVKAFKYFQNKSHGFSLNITEDDLRANYLPSFLKHLANEYTIDPSMVTLEILENISAYGSQQALEQLLELKDAGFKLALDDFGSEKSNFCRLQQMNVDYIKIDGSFIKDINTNKNNLDICKTIVHLAQSIKCEVIAEFVHSKDVFETVKNIGIPYSQGYYFGEPKSIIEHC
jgi:EAL domain-containing protein (putative c-di-GMP-specific phosphodiesterase class I)